jgi:predicted DNA-binding protein
MIRPMIKSMTFTKGLKMATTIELPRELKERLEAHKIRTGASMNKVMALALERYLSEAERKLWTEDERQRYAAAQQVISELNEGSLSRIVSTRQKPD